MPADAAVSEEGRPTSGSEKAKKRGEAKGRGRRVPAGIFYGRIVLLVLTLLAWEFVSGRLIDSVYIGSPTGMVEALVEHRAVLLEDATATVKSALTGFALGVIFGVFGGFLFARIPAFAVFDPFLLALNALPRPALAPLFVIWFGLGSMSKIVLAFSIVFFLVFYNTHAGVRAIDNDLLIAMRVMGAKERHVVRFVLLPAIVSWVFAALRVGVAYALFGAIVGEFAGATIGLGYRLTIARGLLQTNLVFAILFVLVVISLSLGGVAKLIENRLLRWRPPVLEV